MRIGAPPHPPVNQACSFFYFYTPSGCIHAHHREAPVQKVSCFPCHCEEAQPTWQYASRISLVLKTLPGNLHPKNRQANTCTRIPRTSPPLFNMAGRFIPPVPYHQTNTNSPQAHWRPGSQTRTASQSATAVFYPHAQNSPQRSPSGTPAQKTPRFHSPA